MPLYISVMCRRALPQEKMDALNALLYTHARTRTHTHTHTHTHTQEKVDALNALLKEDTEDPKSQ